MDPTYEPVTALEEELCSSELRQLAPEKHLDSPITTTMLSRLHELKSAAEKLGDFRTSHDFERFISRKPERSYSGIRVQAADAYRYMRRHKLPDFAPILDTKCVPWLYEVGTMLDEDTEDDCRRALDTYAHAVVAHLRLYSDILKKDELQRMRTRFSVSCNLPDTVRTWAIHKKYWSGVVEHYRAFHAHGANWISSERFYRTRALEFEFSRGFLHVRRTNLASAEYLQQHWMMTFEQLQMIQDAVTARFNTFLAVHFNLHNGTPALLPAIHEILDWSDRCIMKYGDAGYEIVKAPEAMFKTRINTLAGGDILPVSSYSRTRFKIAEKEMKIQGQSTMTQSLDVLCMSCRDINDCAELFGLVKLSGHPVVDPVKSARAVRAEAAPYGYIDPIRVIDMTRCFKHILLSGYIARHTHWPPFALKPALGTTLRRLWLDRVSTLPINSYPLSDLDHIQFGQFIDFDYSEDYLKFLDDKAICPGAQHTAGFWFGGETETRRLLLKALTEEKIDMRVIVDRLRHGRFNDDELIVELTQKERELKTSARCFCKLPLEVRCYFTLLEYNLGEHFMSQYIPQQTMTMSATDTKRRLYDIATTRGDRTALLELDFSRWNLRMRRQTVHPVARIIEDAYGLPGAWSQAHIFFFLATIVLTDKHSLPDGVTPNSHASSWPEGELVWRRHRGGFEGIQQKLWTLVTIAMVYSVLINVQATFIMAGQGDNQILAITFVKTQTSLQDALIRLLALLEIRCRQLNHEVKPDECIDSLNVVTYSKELYANGRHILYTLKFASRTFSRADSDVPSLSAEIANVCSTAGMVANTLLYPLKAYYWQCLHICLLATEWIRSPLHITERTSLKRLFRPSVKDAEATTFALSLPGSLGGLPIQSYSRYYIRGEVDSLTWDVASVRKLAPTFRIGDTDLNHLCAGRYKPRKVDLVQLLVDPQSIPLERPKDARRLIKDAVTNAMRSQTKNTWIREIVDQQIESVGDDFRRILATARPLYPDVLADLYKTSLAGLSDSLRARFNMTRTITKLIGGRSFLAEIRIANQQLLRFVYDRYAAAKLAGRSNRYTGLSVFKTCQLLRSFWSPELDNAAIGTYCPLEFRLTRDRAATSGITAATRDSAVGIHLSPGPYPPNFGTRTRQKISTHGYKIVTSSDTVKDLKLLTTTCSELRAGPYLRSVISDVCESRSPWSLDTLEKYFPSHIGGSAVHRHARIQSRGFATLGSNTIPSHVNYTSDNAGVLSGGENDYPVVFQEHYLFLTQLIQGCCKDVDRPISFTVAIGDEELHEIPDSDVETRKPDKILAWPPVSPLNKLAYVSSLQFSLVADTPPTDIVPLAPTLSRLDTIVMSTLLFRMKYRTESVVRLRNQVLHAIEPFDMKEFSRIPGPRLIALIGRCVALVATYHAVMGPDKFGREATIDIVRRLAASVAPGFVRMLLHPAHQQSRLARDSAVSMVAGQKAPRLACLNLEGVIAARATELLFSGQLCEERLELTVCADQAESLPRILIMCELYRTLYLNEFKYDWRVDLVRRRLSSAESMGRILGGASHATRLILTECRAIDTQSFLRAHKGASLSRFITAWPILNQRLSDLEEYTRELRTKPSATERSLPGGIDATMLARLRGNGSGIVANRPRTRELSTIEACHDKCVAEGQNTLLDQSVSYASRRVGRYASAYAIWITLLYTLRRQIAGRRVLLVGVGRGAAARAALEVGAVHVVGLDLRVTFPAIVQREFSYVPQEVLDASRATQFSWANECFNSSGSVFEHCLDELIEEYRTEIVIIDIETQHNRVLDLICSTKGYTVSRVAACIPCLSSIHGLHSMDHIRCLSTLGTVGSPMWLVSGRGTGTPKRSITVNSWTPSYEVFTLDLPTSHETRTARVNDFLRPCGIELKTTHLSDIRTASATLRHLSLQTNDTAFLQTFRYSLLLLNAITQSVDVQGTPVYNIYYYSTLERHVRRTVLLYFSNTFITFGADLLTLNTQPT
jgi:hypothetical protein